jgi:hypothetical protein
MRRASFASNCKPRVFCSMHGERKRAIARPGHAAAALLHRTFPIVIGEIKGWFSVHSKNIV